MIHKSRAIWDMEHFGKILKGLREGKGMSQPAIALKVGVTAKRVSDWEQEPTPTMRGWNYAKVAEALGMTTAALDEAWKGKPEPPIVDVNVEPYSKQAFTDMPDLPIFELRVAAGKMTEGPEAEEWAQKMNTKSPYFAVRIRGDSMEKSYPDGSLVMFKCLTPECGDGRGSLLDLGGDYYVQVAESATFKRLASFDDESLTFVALNKRKYPDKIVALRRDINRMAKAQYILVSPGK